MAHVLAKHASIREDQARQAAVVTRVVTDMSNDPDLTALALAKTKLTMASFSRAQEFEADGIGVGISARAHFDPYGASRFLTAMERNAALKAGKTSLDPRAQDFLSSHPATPERVQNAQNSARQYSSPEGGERDRETYLAAIDNIVYGEDPSEGFVRGRRFLHPKLGFTFAAPDTFTLDNTAQAVIGVREGGTQAMRFDVVRVPAEQTLGDYLNSGWMEGVEKASTEDLTINGFPAASASAHGDQWQFKVYALRFGSDVYRFIFAAKQKTTESDRNARETVNSFRRLTLEEIQAARPLRIKVITVQPGDTVESLSHRMAGVDRPAAAFSHPQRAGRQRPGEDAGPRQDRGGLTREGASLAVIPTRSEAFHRCSNASMDCFVATLLAMTERLSAARLEHDHHARHLRFMWPQTGERCVAPVGETDDFAALRFHLRHADRLQHLETACIEKERVIPRTDCSVAGPPDDCREEPRPRIGSGCFTCRT